MFVLTDGNVFAVGLIWLYRFPCSMYGRIQVPQAEGIPEIRRVPLLPTHRELLECVVVVVQTQADLFEVVLTLASAMRPLGPSERREGEAR